MPAAVADLGTVEATITAALAEHRPELEQLVRARVEQALAELTRELVEAELAARSNGNRERHVRDRRGASKRCSACGEELPLERFPRDKARLDGRRSRCRDCTSKLDGQVRRQRIARQREAEPVPFAGTQSPTSHEDTRVPTSDAFSPVSSDSAGLRATETAACA